MSTVTVLLLSILVSMLLNTAQCAPVNAKTGRKVVLMSMDGFRYDYLTKANTPNFDALIASGVTVPYVNNIFSSLTFPSHYTIVTGCYEETHGIVGNKMYDPVFNASFRMGNTETRWWDGAEPIWVNAVKSGLKVGTYFWPGSETLLDGVRPTEWRRYDSKVPFKERIDTLVDSWLSSYNFDLGIIYFNEPDHSGHEYGPDAPEMIPVIERMDGILGYFMKKLESANLKEKVDFIITSDHGMTEIDRENRLIGVTDYANDSLLIDVVGGGAVANLRPQPGMEKELVEALSGIDHLTVYLKEDIPENYHYKNNRRVMPVVAMADEGWEVRKYGKSTYLSKGNHGYSNDHMSMKPIFIASGPSFKKGAKFDPIKSVDIYPLLCHLLGLEPAPNNGSYHRALDFLQENPNSSSSNQASVYVIFLLVVFIYVPFI